jgi:hypothetical protein
MHDEWEYLEQISPIGGVGDVCNKAAADGWELFQTIGVMHMVFATGGIVNPNAQPVPACSLVFRRQVSLSAGANRLKSMLKAA